MDTSSGHKTPSRGTINQHNILKGFKTNRDLSHPNRTKPQFYRIIFKKISFNPIIGFGYFQLKCKKPKFAFFPKWLESYGGIYPL